MSNFKTVFRLGELPGPQPAPPAPAEAVLSPELTAVLSERPGLSPLPLVETLARQAGQNAWPRRPIPASIENAWNNPFGKPVFPEDLPPEPIEGDNAEAPPVVAPPEKDMRTHARNLLGAGWDAVMAAAVGDDADLADRRVALLKELADLAAKLGDFLNEIRTQKISSLTQQQEQKADQCREQREAVFAKTAELEQAQAALKKAADKRAAADAALAQHRDSRPDPATWPTRRQLANWQKRLPQLESDLQAAIAEETAQSSDCAIIRRQLQAEQNKLNELAQQERTLRQRLSGQPVAHEFGLQGPAEL